MPDLQLISETAPELSFSDLVQRERQWVDDNETVWAWRNSSSGSGWHYWEYGEDNWAWYGLIVHLHAPFRLIPISQEVDEDDGVWVIQA